MSSEVKQFPLDSSMTLFKSSLYNLKATISKRKNEKIKRFHSIVDLFILNIDKLDETKPKIGLNFERINLLESIMKGFYEKVMDFYTNIRENSLRFQIDLKLGTQFAMILRVCSFTKIAITQPFFELEYILKYKYV